MHQPIEGCDLVKVRLEWSSQANLTLSDYDQMYQQSIKDPQAFWAQQAESFEWIKKWNLVKETSFQSPIFIKWFSGGKLNVSVNCVDRHLATQSQKTAIIWEPDRPDIPARMISYQELYDEVNRAAKVLLQLGVKKGDRVTIYMPMVPETAYFMLACARIGAIHSVIFAGFSAEAIRDRIKDADSQFIITSDIAYRGGKQLLLKPNVDEAIDQLSKKPTVLLVNYYQQQQSVLLSHEKCYWTLRNPHAVYIEPVAQEANDPLFILYTSGSTGKPKGVLHGTAGYLIYAACTHRWVFDYKPQDVYWCSADVGWVTGHSYIIYGPLANGATTLMFEGVPHFPDSSRFWKIVDKHQVNIFYTAPTAIRSLMREGDEFVKQSSRKSLRILGSVGEPINPEAWRWYFQVVGDSRSPVVDTWWQTETGGILIAPIPGVTDLKPGSATRPLFGIKPKLLTPEGAVIEGVGEGVLVLEDSWPGQMQTVFGNHQRFEETYFLAYPGYYFTGDGCRRDEQGYYWISGRVDDVINVSGHRLGTAEIESALVAHDCVAEAAVVGVAHDIKGQGIYAYVTLKKGESYTPELKKILIDWVRAKIGPIATPEYIHWAPGLPKTRSGKIMRRILRKMAEGQFDSLGDITTLSEPLVIEWLKLEAKP